MLKRYTLRQSLALLLLLGGLVASPAAGAQCPVAQAVLPPAGPTTFPLGGSVVLRAAAISLGFNGGLTGPDNTPHTLAAQPDGKILVGGQFSEYNDVAHVGLLRILPDGAPDTTFVVARRTAPSQRLTLIPYALAVQPDGRVLAGGYVQNADKTYRNMGLVRLLADGSLDKSFAATASSDTAAIYPISLQPDGKIIIGGFTNTHLAIRPYVFGQRAFVMRLNPDGTRDPSLPYQQFLGGPLNSLVLQPSGQVVVE